MRARQQGGGRPALPSGPIRLLLLVAWLGFGAGLQVQAQPEPARAGLVIQDASGRVRSYCIALNGPEVSGLELLQQSGEALAWQAVALGSMVCRIGDTGCDYPAQACWCHCRSLGGDCRYWAYHKLEDGDWTYAIVGPSARRLHAGDVDGWAWGPGSLVSGATPPLMTFAEICAAPAARGLGTATAPARPAPPATEGPAPGPGVAPAATPPTPADGPGRRLLSTRVVPTPAPSSRGGSVPATATPMPSPRRPGDSGAADGAPSPGPSRGGVDLDATRPAAATAPARADGTGASAATEVAAAPGMAARDAAQGAARDPSHGAEPLGPGDRGAVTGQAGAAPDSVPPSSRAVAAGLDLRSILGYALFALVFLGLAGLALSGRD